MLPREPTLCTALELKAIDCCPNFQWGTFSYGYHFGLQKIESRRQWHNVASEWVLKLLPHYSVSIPVISGPPWAMRLWRENEISFHSQWSLYKVRTEFGRQTSNYNSFDKDDIAKIVEMCDGCLKLGSHVHMFGSAAQFLLGYCCYCVDGKRCLCRRWGQRASRAKKQCFTKETIAQWSWEIGWILLRTLSREVSNASAWSSIRCIYGKEVWIWVVHFWRNTTRAKSFWIRILRVIQTWQ